jgi:hypothetical protein
MGYNLLMSATVQKLVNRPDADALERRAFAIRLQEIEGNPLTAEDLAMFDMFDREGLTSEERLAYITAEARKSAAG